MPYYVECEIEGCKALIPDAGAKRHVCMDCRKKLKIYPFNR